MTDVLEMIKKLEEQLWRKYGNVLEQPYTQDEKHMTYYASRLLEENGEKHRSINKKTYYTEKVMQDAFTAGRRIGRKDAAKEKETLKEEIIEDLIDEMERMKYE